MVMKGKAMASAYKSHGTTRAMEPGQARKAAVGQYLHIIHRGAHFTVRRVFPNDGNGPARHNRQSTCVLQRKPPIGSSPIDLKHTKAAALAELRGACGGGSRA